MSKDYSKYIQYCCLCLIDGIHDLISKIVSNIRADFDRYLDDRDCFASEKQTILSKTMKEAKKKIKTAKATNLHGYMVQIVAISDLLKSHLFKNKIISKDVIVLIGYILNNSGTKEDDDTIQELKTYTLLILEQVCKNTKVTLNFSKIIVDHILPALVSKIQDSDNETKLLCLKALTDLITKYLRDDKIYDADGTQETTKKINEVILKRLFPHYGSILSDDGYLPQFGLKLLCAIVETNSAFVTILKKLKLVDIMMEYFSEDHPRFNGHLIKIVCGIVESKELKLEDLQEYNLVSRLNKVLSGVIDNESQNYLDPLLDIVYELLHYIAETMREPDTDVAQSTFKGLVNENFEMCVKLLGFPHLAIVEKASQNLIGFIQISTMTTTSECKVCFYSRHLNSMFKALSHKKATVNKRVLKCIFWGLNQQTAVLSLTPSEKKELNKVCEECARSDDPGLQVTANEILKMKL